MKINRVLFLAVVPLLITLLLIGAFVFADPTHAANQTFIGYLNELKDAKTTIYVFNVVAGVPSQGAEGIVLSVGADYFCISQVPDKLCYLLDKVSVLKVEP